MIPAIDYDVDGDGTTKVAIDVLRRVKLRADALLDGAIFYNYQMQEGDNAEIIADKYYGSSQYHWVVLMMNDIIDHTYDLTLNDANFESYINATYGSYPRASGVSANLTYYITPDGADNPNSGINSESHPTELTYEAQTFDKQIDLVTGLVSDDTTRPRHTGAYGDVVDSSASGNTGIVSGSFPAGNTTAIWIYADSDTNPFKNVEIGDTVNLFVPDTWYDRSTGTHTGNITAVTSGYETKSFTLQDDASSIPYRYEDGTITITSEGNGTTGITGNTRIINTYDSETRVLTITDPFLTIPVSNSVTTAAAWSYIINFNAAKNFPLISYTSPAKVVAKSVYKAGEALADETSNPYGAWIADTNPAQRYFQINVETDSTTFENFSWDKTRDLVSIQTGIHHFERDLYDASGSTLLLEKVWITQEQYVNTSLGTASTKRIVYNLDYEAAANEDKRVIHLLKKDYLEEFVEEFKTLMKLGD